MENHICEPMKYCMCDLLADEPDEDCAIHGFNSVLRCQCGRYCKHELISI